MARVVPLRARRWSHCAAVYFVGCGFLVSLALFAILLSLTPPETATAPALPLSHASDPIPDPEVVLDPVPEGGPSLKLKNNVLRLAIFSDLHFGEEENGWGIGQDINSTRVMSAVLDSETLLDLVVLNGDLITGENTFKENSSAYVDQIVVPMVSRQIPWASTYGNHDSDVNISRSSIFEAEKRYPLSYTTQLVPSLPGLTNYYLLVNASDGRPTAILWFFDSRGGRDPDTKDDVPNWVADETAAWFLATSKQLRAYHGPLPSIAFVHIPPHPFLAAQKAGLDPARFPGINEDVPVAIQGTGRSDDAFVRALRQEEFLHSIYVGHDHGDAWCGIWTTSSSAPKERPDDHAQVEEQVGPPFLCFSRHTGYGGYGRWDRGARIVQLAFEDLNGDGLFDFQDEMRVETWVRMENGSVITRVTLNETYGVDSYLAQAT